MTAVVLGLAALVWQSPRNSGATSAVPRGAVQVSTHVSAEASALRATVDRYCVTCHNERLKTAGLTLDRLDSGDVAGDAATWEKGVKKLRSGAMPPAGARRPDAAAADALASWLETTLDRAAAANPKLAVTHTLEPNPAQFSPTGPACPGEVVTCSACSSTSQTAASG